MTHLLALALVSLCTAFKIRTGLVQIRPFDALVCMMLIAMLARGRLRLPHGIPAGFLVLLPYLLWHVLSAMTLGLDNGLREGLQMATTAGFAFVVAAHLDEIDYEELGTWVLVGLLIVTAYNVYWHISHGYWSGWKKLNDPKRALSFLPLVVGCLLVFSGGPARRRYWLVWGLVGTVVLFSGERKALLIFLILWAAQLARGRVFALVPLAAIGLAGLAAFGSITQNPYLSRQIDSVLNPVGSSLPVSAIARGEVPESLSNAQRTFALRLSTEMFESHPVLGVGTNGYREIVRARFSSLPAYLLLAPHGAAVLIMAENGLLGLTLYAIVWGVAALRLRKVLRHWVRRLTLDRHLTTVLMITLLVPSFLYVMLEAAGTHSVVILIMVSLAPDAISAGLRRLAKRLGPAFVLSDAQLFTPRAGPAAPYPTGAPG